MKNLIVKDPAEFTDILRKLIPEDRGHADVLNPFFEVFLNNDIFLKKLAEKIQEKSNEHIENESIHVTSQDKQNWSGKASTAVATQTKNGLESAADKKKLDGIKEGAEVNQNAFSNVKVGSITVSASGKTATFILEAGSNVTIDADNANKKIVITANKDGGNADKLDGYHAEHFAAADHGHDGRYYTKTESDNLLNQKAASNHNHNGGKYLAGQGGNGGYSFINDGAYDTGMFSDNDGDLYFMQNGQKWYASHSDHEHDGRYYTESEVNNLLSGKAAADHGHDGRYYTKTESDNLLNQKANSSHNHNGIYYTKEEVNNSLNGKASLNHTHSYASAVHNHDERYRIQMDNEYSAFGDFISIKNDYVELVSSVFYENKILFLENMIFYNLTLKVVQEFQSQRVLSFATSYVKERFGKQIIPMYGICFGYVSNNSKPIIVTIDRINELLIRADYPITVGSKIYINVLMPFSDKATNH